MSTDGNSPHAVEVFGRIWKALHTDLHPRLTAADVAYLKRILLDVEDDLIAHLLAAKLGQAVYVPQDTASLTVARIGSHVHFTLDGRHRHAMLVHGSADGSGLLGSGTRYGAALFGLRAGDEILWPCDDHRLVEVRLLDVRRRERRGCGPIERNTFLVGRACASG